MRGLHILINFQAILLNPSPLLYCFAATGEKEKYPQNKEKLKQQQNDVVERFPPSSPAVPCNATEHGKREIHYPIPVIESIHTSPLCFEQNIGEKE